MSEEKLTVEQLTVFVENRPGRSWVITNILAENNINLVSFNIADTSEFGLIRFIADDPERAKAVLKENKIVARSTEILVVELSHEVGGLAKVLNIFKENNINIAYLYAFVGNKPDKAVVGIKVENTAESIEKLKASELTLLTLKDLL